MTFVEQIRAITDCGPMFRFLCVFLFVNKNLLDTDPYRTVVRWFFHCSERVVDTTIVHSRQQGLRDEDMVDSETTLRVIFKPSGTVVKPAITIRGIGVDGSPSYQSTPNLLTPQTIRVPRVRKNSCLSAANAFWHPR